MLALRNFAQCVRSAEVRLEVEKFGRSSEVSKFRSSLFPDEDEDEDEVFESDSSDEDVDDFLFNYDLNNQTKLFPSCPLSIADACLAILKLARHLNLDKSGMKHLLDCIRSICPIDMKLPRTINALMKIIGEWIGS